MITRELLCYTCRAARMSHGQLMGCRGIGNPVLVMRYGNKCRRFEARKKSKPTPPPQPSLFDEAGENQPSINPNNERI